MKDRAMQALHLLALAPIAETVADPHSYGFRSQRSTADAIEHCFKALSRRNSAKWVLEADIKGCFDNISHQWMLENIPMDKGILHKWLNAGYMEKGQCFPTREGTPQGGIISPTLSNMVLDGIQDMLAKAFPWSTKRGQTAKVNLVRYADDFIITGRSKELLVNEVKPLLVTFLAERGLSLSEEKTKVTHIENGFDFLGQNVRKYGEKLLIKPSRKNTQTFMSKVRDVINSNKQARQTSLIRQLNPLIRGWVNYHKHVVAKDAFQRIDFEIWRALWKWARRRHPKKNLHWIKDRYFLHIKNRTWTFACKRSDLPDVKKNEWLQLLYAGEVPIKRHCKIKAYANPYDPQWESYFEKRVSRKMYLSLKGKKKLQNVWFRQEGKCPICHQYITKDTGWETHHVIPRVEGGKDTPMNLTMLHPNCHRQIHSNPKLSVKLLAH